MRATDEQIVAAIRAYWAEHGFSPSLRDVGKMVGLKSAAAVGRRIAMLRDAGVLTYEDGVPRSIVMRSRDE